MAGPRKSGKKEKKSVPRGIAHISSTFNNTHVAFTDVKGNVVCWATGGTENFKNSRKSSPFAAQLASDKAGKKAVYAGLRVVDVSEKCLCYSRESAIRAIQAAGIRVTVIRDITPVQHNGCRPIKKRRV